MYTLNGEEEKEYEAKVKRRIVGLGMTYVDGSRGERIEETGCCGWWIDIGVEPLADALRTALNLPREELEEMGRRGRALVEEKYTWKAVGENMVEGYGEILTVRNSV